MVGLIFGYTGKTISIFVDSKSPINEGCWVCPRVGDGETHGRPWDGMYFSTLLVGMEIFCQSKFKWLKTVYPVKFAMAMDHGPFL